LPNSHAQGKSYRENMEVQALRANNHKGLEQTKTAYVINIEMEENF